MSITTLKQMQNPQQYVIRRILASCATGMKNWKFAFKENQRVYVRNKECWVIINKKCVQIIRKDIPQIHWDDCYGELIPSKPYASKSVWVTPDSMQFDKVKDAVEYVRDTYTVFA
jgi:hypothetical protein